VNDPRSTTPHLESYYARRAREYEQVYEKPERQRELAWLRARIPRLFAGRTVLEVACGTGYWTQYIAKTARKVHACDINEPVLEIAREKGLPTSKVDFFKADAVALEGVPAGCDAAFAGFWWSHVKKADLARFVENLSRRLEPGSVVAILDNTFTDWSSTPLSRRDAEGNTYQMRTLSTGEKFEILKNFPTREELTELVRPVAAEAHLEELTYYWLLVFTLK
jgi:ubiquinone/menaquinone biosynthesis C-methylase UbiE